MKPYTLWWTPEKLVTASKCTWHLVRAIIAIWSIRKFSHQKLSGVGESTHMSDVRSWLRRWWVVLCSCSLFVQANVHSLCLAQYCARGNCGPSDQRPEVAGVYIRWCGDVVSQIWTHFIICSGVDPLLYLSRKLDFWENVWRWLWCMRVVITFLELHVLVQFTHFPSIEVLTCYSCLVRGKICRSNGN